MPMHRLILILIIVPSHVDAYCTDACIHANDGQCDDGGSGSEYFDCAFGRDCSDCGSRNLQRDNTTLDLSLTRSDCSNVTMVIGVSSPCALNLQVGFYDRRLLALVVVFSLFIGCIIVFVCVFGLFIMYAQTHYDLNPSPEVFQENCLKFNNKEESMDLINVWTFPRAFAARSNLPFMVGNKNMYSKMGGGINHIRLADYHHRINTEFDTVSNEGPQWRALRQLLKALNVCVYLDDPYLPGVELFTNVRFYARCVLFVISVGGIAALLILPVQVNSAAILETVECVQESCHAAGWNSVGQHEFVCKWSTGGEYVQPNFWRDIVDVAQIITTVVVATFVDLTAATITGTADPNDTGEVVSSMGASEMVGDMKLTTIQLVVSAAALAIGISTDLATDSSCLSNIVYQNHVSDARFTLMKPESTWETQLCLVMRASVTNTALITFALALRRYRSSTLKGESELKILVDKMLSIGKIMSRVPSTNFKHVVKFFEYEAGQIKDQLVGGGFAIWVSKTTVRLTMTFYALVGLFCVIRSWRLLPIPMLLITVTSFGWLPVVTNLSELLLGRLSFKVREQAKEAVRVTFWVSMLRGLLVLAQGNLIAAVYGDYEAAMFTYHSYFMVGDALETLAETLTFNFEGFFDFSVETEATMLSIVVWVVELVAIVGTAAPSRFAELVYRIARSISPWLGDKVQTAEKIHQKVSQSSAALTELAKAQAIKKKDTCLSKCFKKKKEWNWKRYARLEGAQLEQPKIEFEAWHAKIKDGLERIESELDPDCENERPCTWCMYGPNWERRSKEQAWQDVLPNYPNGNELAPLRRAKAEDGLITDAALQYLLWNERWPAWCEDRDMKKREPEPMAAPKCAINGKERPDVILRWCEEAWSGPMGGKLGGRLIVPRIALVCQILDRADPNDETVIESNVRSLSALDSGTGVPIAEAAKLLLACMSEKGAESRKQKTYEGRLDDIRGRLYALGIREDPRASATPAAIKDSIKDVKAVAREVGRAGADSPSLDDPDLNA